MCLCHVLSPALSDPEGITSTLVFLTSHASLKSIILAANHPYSPLKSIHYLLFVIVNNPYSMKIKESQLHCIKMPNHDFSTHTLSD